MPEYIYTCKNKHRYAYIEPMVMDGHHDCPECGEKMWRKPQPVTVVWNGGKPSDGEMDPEVKAHLDNIDESRDRFEEMHEIHEKQTEDEKD